MEIQSTDKSFIGLFFRVVAGFVSFSTLVRSRSIAFGMRNDSLGGRVLDTHHDPTANKFSISTRDSATLDRLSLRDTAGPLCVVHKSSTRIYFGCFMTELMSRKQ